MRVRVEASKKRLTIVLPRSAGTFLIGALAHFLERLGGVENELELLAGQVLEPDQVLAEDGHQPASLHAQVDRVAPVELLDADVDPVAGLARHRQADDVGLDRQLAAAAVDQHAEQDAARPAEVGELVERGPHGPPGVEHVVDDDARSGR